MSGREWTLADWVAEQQPPDARFSQSLAGIGRRVRTGDSFFVAVRELLDEFALLPRRELKERALAERPKPTGDDRLDAYLAALGEHLAAKEGLDRPAWMCEPDRFLERFWFVSEVPGLAATAVAQSPAAFRRRGIFIGESTLARV